VAGIQDEAAQRGYKILHELNTYPSVTYLNKLTRQSPA
jgi:hypothetical protein